MTLNTIQKEKLLEQKEQKYNLIIIYTKMIKIKYNKKPDLPICAMNCDAKLHDKLDKYDLTKFLNCHSCNLIV